MKTNWALFKLVGSAASGVLCAKVGTGVSDWTLSCSCCRCCAVLMGAWGTVMKSPGTVSGVP